MSFQRPPAEYLAGAHVHLHGGISSLGSLIMEMSKQSISILRILFMPILLLYSLVLFLPALLCCSVGSPAFFPFLCSVCSPVFPFLYLSFSLIITFPLSPFSFHCVFLSSPCCPLYCVFLSVSTLSVPLDFFLSLCVHLPSMACVPSLLLCPFPCRSFSFLSL